MIFYSIVTGLSVWLAALAQNKKESAPLAGKQSSLDWRLLAVLSAVPLFLAMAFRYDVGTDYLPIYHEIFQQHKMGGHQTVDWDPAYWLIFRVCSALFSSSVSVFIVSSLLIIGFLWVSVWKLSPAPWLSILVFVVSRQFFISLNGVRQSTALALISVALIFVAQKSFWKYAVCVIAACMFHASVIVFLPLYILIWIPLTPAVSLGLLVLGSVLRTPLLWLLRALAAHTKYANYFGSVFDSTLRFHPQTFPLFAFLFIVVCFAISQKPIRKEEPLFRFLFNLNVVSLFLSFNLDLFPQAERISWSLEFPNIIFMPMVLCRIENKVTRRVLTGAVLAAYTLVMWYRIVMVGDHEVLPYRCVFFPEFIFP